MKKESATTSAIFLVSSPNSAKRLVRATSAAEAKKFIFGGTSISKASGNDVATILEDGGTIELAMTASGEVTHPEL